MKNIFWGGVPSPSVLRMKHTSLAAHYRPQTFAEVTGQDMITTVLSRAAAEDRVAPAYLLSGTRGVGKTTIARILAKALNCKEAPTAEPCNVCPHCLMITQGNHVDVTEIDGASNNSVDDARSLRENIGYAPMEGRYKVFIIDEAHMLTRQAFNALLKTLEEPPPRVVFIFATTEAHKFPITIVSRCQHFIFKRLSEDGLVAHLSRVLEKEAVSFDPQAVRIIARRAAGSVRDSMSLLGQTLALGHESLTTESTRSVLGLAGQELFVTLLQAIAKQDCPTVIDIMLKLSEQGIDIGFFLRELIQLWRTLFLLREAGPSIVPSLELSQEDSTLWTDIASQFAPAHLHAAWHMTLDAQRKIIHSPEPAAALELLLLNLTLMPRLLPLQSVQAADVPTRTAETGNGVNSSTSSKVGTDSAQNTAKNQTPIQAQPQAPMSAQAPTQTPMQGTAQNTVPLSVPVANVAPSTQMPQPVQQTQTAQREQSQAQGTATAPLSDADPEPEPQSKLEMPPQAPQAESIAAMPTLSALASEADITATPPMVATTAEASELAKTAAAVPSPSPVSKAADESEIAIKSDTYTQTIASSTTFTWTEAQEALRTVLADYILRQAQGEFTGTTLCISTKSHTVFENFYKKQGQLEEALEKFYACPIVVKLQKPTTVFKPETVLIEEFSAREELQECLKILDASIFKVRQI